MKRKTVFIWIFILVVFVNCSSNPDESQSRNSDSFSSEQSEIQAVSLKVLQAQLKISQAKGSFTQELLQFAGLKKIMGYLIDSENHDLIIFGQTDPSLPPLYVEDFVLALRNAWFKYAPLTGNTYYYSYPGCSIDPNPATVKKLDVIGRQITSSSSPDQVKDALEDWHNTCKESQGVRVMGIPFDTRFAKIMVKADYDMKLLVDGSDAIDIPGFGSLIDMKLHHISNAVVQNKPIEISVGGMHRFWFYPDSNVYEEDQKMVWIKQSPVLLLTEEMFLSASGQYAGSQRVDPLAQKFTKDFSILYDKVADERPVYQELENLFRFVALAKIINFKSAHTLADMDLTYFLEDFPVAKTRVESQLPGRSAVKEFQHRQEIREGEALYYLWLPSCGGVGINIEANANHFKPHGAGEFQEFGNTLLTARPSADVLYWRRGTWPTTLPPGIQNSIRLQALNRAKKKAAILTVVNKKTHYEVFAVEGLVYKGNDIHDVVNIVTTRMYSSELETIYLDMEDFASADKIEGFATSARMHQTAQNSNIAVRTFSRQEGRTNLQDIFFSNGIRFDRQASSMAPELVTSGLYRGSYKTTLNFLTKVKGTLQRLTIEVFAKTRELAQQFLQRVISHFSFQKFESRSPSELINQFRKELQKEEDDFIIRVIDEVGDSQIVLRLERAKYKIG